MRKIWFSFSSVYCSKVSQLLTHKNGIRMANARSTKKLHNKETVTQYCVLVCESFGQFLPFSSVTATKPRRYSIQEINGQRGRSLLQRKSHSYIPRKGTAWPQSQFLHSCVSEQFIYFQDPSRIFLQQNRQTDLGKSLTDTWMWKLAMAAQFLFCEYLVWIFGVVSLQCTIKVATNEN